MITDEEQAAIDRIQEVEMDFYAPLLFLGIKRFVDVWQSKAGANGREPADIPNDREIEAIMIETYNDLNRKFNDN